MKRTVLKKDPIKEAVCEIIFASDDWDWTIPGLVYNRIREDFPHRQVSHNLQISIDANSDAPMSSTHSGIDKMQFWDSTRQKLVQISDNRLSIHCINVYEGWPKFRVLVQDILTKYESEAPSGSIVCASLRYINDLPLPEDPEQLEIELKTLPRVPNSDKQIWLSWYQQVDILQPEYGAVVTVRAGRQVRKSKDKADPHRLTIQTGDHHTLDLMYSHSSDEPLKKEELPNWLDIAHEKLTEIFFSSMSKEYIRQFDPVEVDE